MAGLYAAAIAMLVLGGILLLTAFRHLFVAHRHWRARRRVAATLRAAWMLVFAALAVITLGLGVALRGYRLLMAEEPIATLDARGLSPQQFAVRLDFADGSHRSATLAGDEWQIDARVIKWTPRAIELGARPLYRVDRLSGRYRDATQAATAKPSIVDLGGESLLDLWQLKKEFPQWLPWIDADYGSAAYLPLVDGARYRITLSPVGGLIARPADEASAAKLRAAGW
jgi:hypothetical protein